MIFPSFNLRLLNSSLMFSMIHVCAMDLHSMIMRCNQFLSLMYFHNTMNNITFIMQRLKSHSNFWQERQGFKNKTKMVQSRCIFAVNAWGEWPSGLKCCYQNWKVPGSNLIGAQPELRGPTLLQDSQWSLGGTCKNAVINIGWVRLPPLFWPKVGCGAAK